MNITEESYVVQPNIISRAIYIMPTMARRLVLLAIFYVQINKPSEMRFSISLHELALSFGFKKTKRYAELKSTIDIASKQVLRFINDDDTITEWIPWLTYCSLNLKTKMVTIQINENLYDYVINIRQSSGFSIIPLSDFLKLESRYAYRWLEIIASRSGHANNDGHFFVRYTLDRIKIMFVVDSKKFSLTRNFRVNILHNPIEEINSKKLGYHIFL
jgi:plasmid replication initiation protein